MSEATIRDALYALADLNGGRLTAEAVLEAAKHRDHPAHPHFTWDDSEAAHQQRLYEARRLIRSVKVEITTEHITIKAPVFVRDPQLDVTIQGYATLGRLKADSDLSRDAAVAEFKRANSHLSRAQAIAIALGMTEEIDQLRRGVNELINRAQQDDAASPAS
jgi:hypothetical protein